MTISTFAWERGGDKRGGGLDDPRVFILGCSGRGCDGGEREMMGDEYAEEKGVPVAFRMRSGGQEQRSR